MEKETKREKIIRISNLMTDETMNLTRSRDNWLNFLEISARLYKRSFNDIVIIAAHKPDVEKCALFNQWSDLGYRVKRGATGIPLIRLKNGVRDLIHVFDVSDTIATKDAQDITTWAISGKYERAITQRYASKYGLTEGAGLESLISERVKGLLDENISNYLNELENNKGGSLIEELDRQNLALRFREIAEESINLMICERCGIHRYINEENLKYLGDFNTYATIAQLGDAVTKTAQTVLTEIAKEVRYCEQYKLNERNDDYGKDNDKGTGITDVQRGERTELPLGRGNTDLSSDGRLGSDTLRTDNVDTPPLGISRTAQTRNVSDVVSERNGTALDGSKQTGERNGGSLDGTDVTGRGDNGGTERERPDNLGTDEKQPQTKSKRDNSQRNNLRISDEETAEENKNPAVSVVKTIEIEKYSERDENGRVKVIGHLTAGEVFEQLQTYLKNNNMLPDDFIDYFKLSYDVNEDREIPEDAEFTCHPNFGGSEGIYLDIAMHSKGNVSRFITGKTLEDGYAAFKKMGDLATECNLMLNGNGWEFERPTPTPEKPQSEKKTEKITKDKIIGNTNYKYIPDKKYRKVSREFADEIASRFDAADIKYSGKINDDDTITFTFGGAQKRMCSKIIDEVTGSETKLENTVIMGNTPYDEIPDKTYTVIDGYIAKDLMDYLNKNKIMYSSKFDFDAKKVTLTYREQDKDLFLGLIAQIKSSINAYLKSLDEATRESTSEQQAEIQAAETDKPIELPTEEQPYILPDAVKADMPDNTVSIEERNEYGYTDNIMLPLNADAALDLFNKNLPVYMLYEDNTESIVETAEDISSTDVLFGIEADVWEKYINSPAYKKEQEKSEEKPVEQPQEELINGIPKNVIVKAFMEKGTGFEHGKFRVEDLYKNQVQQKTRIGLLKKEFGTGGSYVGSDVIGDVVGFSHDPKGFGIEWVGENGRVKGNFSWNVADKILKELVETETYISEKERQEYDRYNFVREKMKLLDEGDIITINGKNYIFKSLYDDYDIIVVPEDPENLDEKICFHNDYYDDYRIDFYALERHDFEVHSAERPVEETIDGIPKSTAVQAILFNTENHFVKCEIEEFFKSTSDTQSRIDFLSDKYSYHGYSADCKKVGDVINISGHKNGISVTWQGKDHANSGTISFENVIKLVDELIAQNAYITDEERRDYELYNKINSLTEEDIIVLNGNRFSFYDFDHYILEVIPEDPEKAAQYKSDMDNKFYIRFEDMKNAVFERKEEIKADKKPVETKEPAAKPESNVYNDICRFFHGRDMNEIKFMYQPEPDRIITAYISKEVIEIANKVAEKSGTGKKGFYNALVQNATKENVNAGDLFFMAAQNEINNGIVLLEGLTEENRTALLNFARTGKLEIPQTAPEKEETPENNKPLHFYKLGDFYEAFGTNARTVSEILDYHIVNRNGEKMTGFPIFNTDNVIKKLAENGYTAEFHEDIAERKQAETLADKTAESHLGFGLFGNGITVYDKSVTDKETGDYKNVAHISEEGTIKYYADDLTDKDVSLIQAHADDKRKEFMQHWNGLTDEDKYYKLLNSCTSNEMLAIGDDKDINCLSVQDVVDKYFSAIILRETEMPVYSAPDVSENAKMTNAEIMTKAFDMLFDKYRYNAEQTKLLSRIEKQLTLNNYDKFDINVIRLPIFQRDYGSLRRVNNILDGRLKDIADEVNYFIDYIKDPEKAEQEEQQAQSEIETPSQPVNVQAEDKPEDSIAFSFGHTLDEFFSESNFLHFFHKENPEISFALANAVLEYLDEKQHTEREVEGLELGGYYDKTDFYIKMMINGKEYTYSGRYDIGDGKATGGGSIADHIRDHIKYMEKNGYLTAEEKEEYKAEMDVILPFLEKNSVLTAEEQAILDDFKSRFPIRTAADKNKNYGKWDYIATNNGDEKTYSVYRLKDSDSMDNTANRQYALRGVPDIEMCREIIRILNDGNVKELQEAITGAAFVLDNLISKAEVSELDTAKQLIADFCDKEYDTSADFSDLSNVDVAYTEIEDEETGEIYALQASFDLKNNTLKRYIDNSLVETKTYDSLEDMINSELVGLDFNDLLDIDEDIAEKHFADHKAFYEEMESIVGDKSYEIVKAFINTKMHGWENDSIKSNRIKKAVYDILGDEQTTEKAFKVFLDNKDYAKGLVYIPSQAKTAEISTESTKAETVKSADFILTEDKMNIGSPKQQFKNNIAAIRLLKELESTGAQATPEQQDILAKYMGWGGLSDAFDSNKTAWATEYAELKEVLTDEEYCSANASILNSHFTSPTIIRAVYTALENIGFESGRILEPAMGVGNFFGAMPENIKENSKLYGVELDSISGRIARQLYPSADIQIKGFQNTAFNSNSFDVVVGNVPFANTRITDKELNCTDLIHDFFFKKSMDKLRPGGVAALITSVGTMDKIGSDVRRYLAERGELLGAVRLPMGAFKNANTEAAADIIFLQKREIPLDLSKDAAPDWVGLKENADGARINAYFADNPEMVLGKMTEETTQYGKKFLCRAIEGADLAEQLAEAVKNISGTYTKDEIDVDVENAPEQSYREVSYEGHRNFCYCVIDDNIYFREGEDMIPQNLEGKKADRMKGLIGISEILQELLKIQREGGTDEAVKAQQEKLNAAYEKFTKEFGLVSSDYNKSFFRDDDTCELVGALENLNEDGTLKSKADIFTKRTIVPYTPPTHADTVSDALTISISEKAKVDFAYMSQLCGKSKEEMIEELKGVVFENPETGRFETADEYLSGNVREKLRIAALMAESNPKYAVNVEHLQAVQPAELTAKEISVQLGSTWVPTKYYEQFMYELLETPDHCRSENNRSNENPFESGKYSNNQTICIEYDKHSAAFGISNISLSHNRASNALVTQTYGTARVNAYKVIEDTLNNKTIVVKDYQIDSEGKKHAVVNKKETLLAQQKQAEVKAKFAAWVWGDFERAKDLCQIYNHIFNSIRPREYDGSHLNFVGMNPNIKLRPHQLNAIAHTLYGGNTLLAHTVGAGKTFEMVASAMEAKRLGLCKKSLFCVPKHIVNQFGKEFMQLYPNANILVATEKDFEKKNRRRFFSRIATGNYDAVIISHSQLEKLPLEPARQEKYLRDQIEETTAAIDALRIQDGKGGFSVKQLEIQKQNLEDKLDRLLAEDKKDTNIFFEDMGFDRLYVDEAHAFKNKFFATKIGRNIAGVNAASASQRATDLEIKIRFMDELTGSKGTILATGTPISNSISELYVMMSYLQQDILKEMGLDLFDAWAGNFTEIQHTLELAPEGTGYQQKTRMAKFFNLPELMALFRMTADIKTAADLDLPVPTANRHIVKTPASDFIKQTVTELAERARKIRQGGVDPKKDNMLKIVNEGRLMALDQRLMNSMLPDDENSKVNVCVQNVYDIWQNTADKKGTQMIFSDLATPKSDGSFDVYNDIKQKLIDKGIPENEIAFIHDCKTDAQKLALFAKVSKGEVRVLLGSTGKMGTGTNCQQLLTALHNLDVPYRPADLEQREGRIIRQGNTNDEVDIYNYITEGTFDAYMYQLLETKMKFIAQIMTSQNPARIAEDVDATVISYAEMKAIASGDTRIKQKMELEMDVTRLSMVFSQYQDNKRKLQEDIAVTLPQKITTLKERIEGLKVDIAAVESTRSSEFTSMTVKGKTYTEKKEAGQALLDAMKSLNLETAGAVIGEYRGFDLSIDFVQQKYYATLKGAISHKVELGSDVYGNLTRIDNALNDIANHLSGNEKALATAENQLEVAKSQVDVPFEFAQELEDKQVELARLNKELSIDDDNSEILPEEERQNNNISTDDIAV